MLIERFNLVYCINKAKDLSNKSIYYELLKVFYTLLDQEEINGVFINNFYYYECLSFKTLDYYFMIKRLQATQELN